MEALLPAAVLSGGALCPRGEAAFRHPAAARLRGRALDARSGLGRHSAAAFAAFAHAYHLLPIAVYMIRACPERQSA